MFLSKPSLIAEISANHCGDFRLAKKLIFCAKKYGADAVKLQTYKPETMTLNSKKKYFIIQTGIWKGYNYWQLYKKAQTPWEWHKKLFDYAKKLNITIFSTPFDESAVDFLEKLKCPIYKVSSFEMTDLALIKKIAQTKKPMIISTGTSSLSEIEMAFKQAKKFGSKDITLLYCVSNYPSKINDFHLNNIKLMKKKFKCKVGLSDHSNDNRIAMLSVAMGAEIFEKHIGLENQKKGLDIKFATKGKDILKYKKDLITAYKLTKSEKFMREKSENISRQYRRTIFAIDKIKKGDKFTNKNIKRIRPGYGISAKFYLKMINKKSLKNYQKGEPIKPKSF